MRTHKTNPGNIILLQVVLVAEFGVLVGNEIGRGTCQNGLHVLRDMNVLAHELHADYPVSEKYSQNKHLLIAQEYTCRLSKQ